MAGGASVGDGTQGNSGLIGLGVVHIGLALVLFTRGSHMTPPASAGLIATMEGVLGAYWVWLLLGERPSGMAAAGGRIVLAAAIGNILAAAAQSRMVGRSLCPGGTTGRPVAGR